MARRFQQKGNLFGDETLGKMPKKYKSKIARFNRKYKKRNSVK